LAGGDDQVDLLQDAVFVDVILVIERAARRFGDAHAHQLIDVGLGAHPRVGQAGVFQGFGDLF